MNQPRRTYRIVVGVDNSAAGHAALEWAMEQAAARDGELIIVHALDPTAGIRAPYAPAPEDAATAAETGAREIGKIVKDVLAGRKGTRAQCRYIVDLPARALVSECMHADLLVVGATHRDGIATVGATSRACLQNAACPTTVVPASAGRGSRSRTQ